MNRKRLRPTTPQIERNLDRLGLFSIQARLGESSSWQSAFVIGGRAVRVQGDSSRGRPHGADADLVLGLQQLFLQQGAPEDNWVHTSANALREASLMTKNGRAFHRMREGLLRIWSTGFIVSEGWRRPDGSAVRFNDAFRVVDQIRFWDQESVSDPPELVPDSTLSVRLGTPVAESLRAGFMHPLNRTVLERLEQPPSRALYRLSEAHRYDDEGSIRSSLTVNLMDWRAACGISSTDTDKIRRALEPAHEELIANNYLSDLRMTGRGQATVLEYLYVTKADPDPGLVRLLREQGVGGPRAVQLARDHADRIHEAVEFLRYRRLAGGTPIRNPGGLLADFLVNRAKYEFEPSSPTDPGIQAAHASAVLERQQQAEREAERAVAAQREATSRLPPAEQWREERGALLLMLRRVLSAEDLARLEAQAVAGTLLATDLSRRATAARARGEWNEFVEALRRRLRSGDER
ncbi:replication initiator protein A [Deinococcus planocerae]|uniref:replication initiator protein A n=1 Tax=Deinococcus planocerae TaxID=1737569 RepID=UPI000C7F03CC|nr:replication initiator protein A [Deinococcus planocerae]